MYLHEFNINDEESVTILRFIHDTLHSVEDFHSDVVLALKESVNSTLVKDVSRQHKEGRIDGVHPLMYSFSDLCSSEDFSIEMKKMGYTWYIEPSPHCVCDESDFLAYSIIPEGSPFGKEGVNLFDPSESDIYKMLQKEILPISISEDYKDGL